MQLSYITQCILEMTAREKSFCGLVKTYFETVQYWFWPWGNSMQLSTLNSLLQLSLSTLSRNVTLSLPTSNLLSRIHFVAKALNNQTGLYDCSSFYLFSLVLLDDFCETICTREKFDHIGILINIDTIALPKSIKHKSQEITWLYDSSSRFRSSTLRS